MTLNSISPSFGSTFLIPFEQIKNKGNESSQIMRQVGLETAKFTDMKNMAQVKEGIAVKIDDKKDGEYLAVMAKYGITPVKMDPNMSMSGDMGLNSYKFMASKLYPNDVEAKAAEFTKMDPATQNKEFVKVYNEFKNTNFSVEKSMNA